MSLTPPTPHVSVVMPVYNEMRHLDEAVRSILGQTYSDFELLIHDDGSTDGSWQRLQEWAELDPRIRLVRSDRNLGLAASGNRAVEHSAAPLIARMDADDISLPDRLEAQVQLFDEQPHLGIVASLCRVIDPRGREVVGPDFWRLARRSSIPPFPHGSMMFRRSAFEAVGGYREECAPWEDIDLVLRMAERSRIAVVPRALYVYRQSDTSCRMVADPARVERAIDLRYRAIDRVHENRPYEDLLLGKDSGGDGRIDPRVFICQGSLMLWSSGRAPLFRRLLRHGRLSLNRHSLTSLVWTGWASASPASLRIFLRLLHRLRNARSKKSLTGMAVEWLPARHSPGPASDPASPPPAALGLGRH